MKTALQLYSLRYTLPGDIPGHLKQLRNMGYDGAEICNFGGDSVKNIAEEMKKAGLEVFSVHTDINEMIEADEDKISLYESLGVRYMPIGWLPEERLAGGQLFEATLEVIKKYSALCKKHGIALIYHNHDFDFASVDGKRKLDLLYSATDRSVLGAELDTCWIYTGGESPLEYLKKYSGRCPILHLKDCVKEGGRQGFRALGDGVLDFPPIIRSAPECQVEWLCVEQDEPSPDLSPMECAERSIRYLKESLNKYAIASHRSVLA